MYHKRIDELPQSVFKHSGACEGPEGGVWCCWCPSYLHCACVHINPSRPPGGR